MKLILSLMVLLLTLVSTNANAWFFFFLPGSVTSSISDAITGDKGENCVGANAKVGDTVRMPDGSYGTIKSLSGNSSRCTSKLPVRALIEVANSSQPTAFAPTINKVSIDSPTPVTQILLPDGTWGEPSPPSQFSDGTRADSDAPLATNPSSTVAEIPAPVESSPPATLPTQSESVASKLRALNALYKEGVINKKDFETKKQEILKSM